MVWNGNLDRQKSEILLQLVWAIAEAIPGPDAHMRRHAGRVAAYCERVGESMGLGEHERFVLALSARFHDIGMLSTPAYVLRKPSALAEEEMEEVRVHPVRGFEAFAGAPALGEIARAIRHHHERVDGSGYPDGLSGEAIPLPSRIILVADAYEAMIHDRPYRRALARAEALDRLRTGAGSQFDPAIVNHFVATLDTHADP